jgi:serine/threonine protein kinase
MWSYTYKHGDRPLEGYTIQRAAGRGGFGEVYYAVSDAGREVALKAITGFEQIELRGIGQLHEPQVAAPRLDLRRPPERQGRWFVIMEYVAGPNLRELLDESPAGLGPQKAAFFLREIGKGLSYLHDCGIVHRDLKPANIFFENGYAKIGDYGLSKAIAPTHHSGQTVTVGTVHYMAPRSAAAVRPLDRHLRARRAAVRDADRDGAVRRRQRRRDPDQAPVTRAGRHRHR